MSEHYTNDPLYEDAIDLLEDEAVSAAAGPVNFDHGYYKAIMVLRQAQANSTRPGNVQIEESSSTYFRLVKGTETVLCDYDLSAVRRYLGTISNTDRYVIEEVIEKTVANVRQVYPDTHINRRAS
jgi:hypothetical protein